MYRFLTVGNKKNKDIKTEDVNILFECLYMEFRNLSEELETFLSNINNCEDFILAIILLNRFYTTKRFNYKLKKYTNPGSCGKYTSTNRSLVDIGLFANKYNKNFANYIILAENMAKVMEYGSLNSMICNNIHRRVYLINNSALMRELHSVSEFNVISLKKYIKYIKDNKEKNNKTLTYYTIKSLNNADELKIRYKCEGNYGDGYVIKFSSE